MRSQTPTSDPCAPRPIFVGYHQNAGGGWSGDVLIHDWEDIESATHSSDIHTKRFKAAEIKPVKVGGEFRFPLFEGDLSQPGQRAKDSRRQTTRAKRLLEIKEEEKRRT